MTELCYSEDKPEAESSHQMKGDLEPEDMGRIALATVNKELIRINLETSVKS